MSNPTSNGDLSPEKFKDIYTDEKFRNAVANAHPCYSSFDTGCKFKYKQALFYPVSYKVTDAQIAEAQTELQRAKAATIEANKNKLMFVCMGANYEARYPGDVCNHRIRGYIINCIGNKYLIEFCRADHNDLQFTINHACDITKKELMEDGNEYDNYNNLVEVGYQKKAPGSYNVTRLMEIVNSGFDCKFTECVIDKYNVRPGDYFSESPK